MAVAERIIRQPSDGINNSEPRYAIGDNQAIELKNLRAVSGVGVESIRPPKRLIGAVSYTPGAEAITDSILIFHRKNANTLWMFAHGGEVYVSQSENGVPVSIGYGGDPAYRIHMVQFREHVYIFNGFDDNKKYDGTNLYNMGIVAPTAAPTQAGTTGALTRTYYYTYYNSVDKTESDPSPALTDTDFHATLTEIGVTASADPQVDQIRIYRTGVGITSPRLADTVANVTANYLENSTDADVAAGVLLAFDKAKPPTLARAIIHNNRMFAWGGLNDYLLGDGLANFDTLWVSNEYQPQYMPVLPFIESDSPTSGGPIQINPGDGGTIMAFVPWGGAGIAFKNTAAYRIQESEVGFYSYQTMPIPACSAQYSAQLTPDGIVWLSQDGWMLLNNSEQVVNFGAFVRETINQIDDLNLVSSAVSRGYYITSFKKFSGEWSVLTFYNAGWQGEHTELVGSSYYTDSDGTLYAGRATGDAGIDRLLIHQLGYPQGQQLHVAVTVGWIDGAREFNVGALSRIRKVRVEGRVLSHDGYKPSLYLNVYDEFGELKESTIFELPVDGAVDVWLDGSSIGQYLSVAVEGTTTRPIRLVAMTPAIERVGRI